MNMKRHRLCNLFQEIKKARQHQARLLDRPSLSSNRQPDPTPADPDHTPMQVDSKPATQHTVAIKEGNDCEPLQHESCGPTAVDKLKNSHSNSVTAPLGQVSGGAKRSASDTELVSHQVSKVAKLGQQPQTAHAAEQRGVAGDSVTVPGADSAGQTADTARQTGPRQPTEASGGFARRAPADNVAFGVCVDLEPVKLEWSPVVTADPSGSAKGLGSSTRVESSSARDNCRPGLQLNPIPKSSPPSSLAKDASEAAVTLAAAVQPSASASAAQEPLQSKVLHPMQIKLEDEHVSTGLSAQLSPGSKSAPETTPLSWTQGVTQTQIKGEQLLEALAQQTHSVKCTAQIDRAHDVGQAQVVLPQSRASVAVPVQGEATAMPIGKQAEHGHTSKILGTAATHQSLVQSLKPPSPAVVTGSVHPHAGVQIPWNGVKAEHWGTPPQSSGVQSQGSAGQVVAPGIRMLHPGLSPALSPGNLSSLESAISVSAVQGAVPRSQPAVPSLKLPESVVNQPPSAGDISFVAAAKAAPIVVKNEAQHEAKRDASNRDVAVNTDMAAVGPASSFNSLNLSALLDRRKQELLGLLLES